MTHQPHALEQTTSSEPSDDESLQASGPVAEQEISFDEAQAIVDSLSAQTAY